MAAIGTLKDISIIKGDSFTEALTFNTIVNGNQVPMDLTVFTNIIMDIRNNPIESAEKFVTVSLGNGISITGQNNNILVITLTSEQTNKLVTPHKQFESNQLNKTNTLNVLSNKPNEYFYFRDIRFIIGSDVSTRLNGRYKIINNITKLP